MNATHARDQRERKRSSMTHVFPEGLPVVDAVVGSRIWGGLADDSPAARVCEQAHGSHRWTSVVVTSDEASDYLMTFCARCYVPKCSALVRRSDPVSECIYASDHVRKHRDASGYWR